MSSISRLEADAIAILKRIGEHAQDIASQHDVMIDALKAEVRAESAAKEGWRRRCLDSDALVDSLREEIKKLAGGGK